MNPQRTLPDGTTDVEAFKDKVVTWFNVAFYQLAESTWQDTHWMGFTVWKTPTDLWMYQQIIFETRPTLIIETGTAHGGSALYFAHLMDLLGGRVMTIDIEPQPNLPQHPRIEYLTGSSVDPAIVSAVRSRVTPADRVMVVLDSDHSQTHVAAELSAYALLVSSGCYLIVEDTNVNGHPVFKEHGPGPAEAVDAFLPQHPEFARDSTRERYLLTHNPGGFLNRR